MQSYINYAPMSLPAFQSIPQIWSHPFPLLPFSFLPITPYPLSRPIFFKSQALTRKARPTDISPFFAFIPARLPTGLRSRASLSTRSTALYVTPCSHLPLVIQTQPSLPPCVTASALLSFVEKPHRAWLLGLRADHKTGAGCPTASLSDRET